MIKDFKYILKRIIIGVGIALTLMFLKGNLLLGVSAKGTLIPNGFSVYYGDTEDELALQTVSNGYSNYYGRQFGATNSRSAVWKFNSNLDTSLTYDFNFTGYFSVLTNSSFNVRGFIQDSTGFVNSCTIDSSIWSRLNPSSTQTQLSSDVVISCNNVQLQSSSFNFYLMNIVTIQNGFVGISPISYKENDIISNQNQNTQDIIDNQNSNNQAQIESQKVCKKYDISSIQIDGYYLNVYGEEKSTARFGISDYISIDENTDILPLVAHQSATAHYCFYNVNKTLISCHQDVTLVVGSKVSIPNGSSYVRFSFNNINNEPQLNICRNGNQAITESQQEINNTLNNDNVTDASSSASSFFGDFQSNSHGLSGIISSPLRLIQSLSSSTCSSLQLPLPFVNQNATIPCMSTVYERYPTFLALWQLITTGLIAYNIIVRLFGKVHDFQDPTNDRIEVLSL